MTTTQTKRLMDAETGEDLGEATAEQIEWSDRAAEKDGGSGIILVSDDGTPVAPDSWDAQHRPVRHCYTSGD